MLLHLNDTCWFVLYLLFLRTNRYFATMMRAKMTLALLVIEKEWQQNIEKKNYWCVSVKRVKWSERLAIDERKSMLEHTVCKILRKIFGSAISFLSKFKKYSAVFIFCWVLRVDLLKFYCSAALCASIAWNHFLSAFLSSFWQFILNFK